MPSTVWSVNDFRQEVARQLKSYSSPGLSDETREKWMKWHSLHAEFKSLTDLTIQLNIQANLAHPSVKWVGQYFCDPWHNPYGHIRRYSLLPLILSVCFFRDPGGETTAARWTACRWMMTHISLPRNSSDIQLNKMLLWKSWELHSPRTIQFRPKDKFSRN